MARQPYLAPAPKPKSPRRGNLTNVLNPVRIAILKRKGLSFREIGKRIAEEDGRAMPYQHTSVYIALR